MSCVEEFICKYYRLLVSMLLPYCIKKPECKGILVCIVRVTNKTISQLFIASFLRIYAHVRLNEETAIGNACIDLVLKCTGCTLSRLMNTDVKVNGLFYFINSIYISIDKILYFYLFIYKLCNIL